MRKLLVVPVALMALAASSAAAVTANVKITKTGFSPATVKIASGDTVSWKNTDTVKHQIVANNGSFASPILAPGSTYSHKFPQAGTFPYHDALKTTLKGTVTVTGPPPSVSLGASSPIVVFGTQISLTGAVSNKKAGEDIKLYAQPYGQASFEQLAIVQTAANGVFDFTTTPQILTTYKAQWGSRTSGLITVQVAPKITLSAPHHGYFHTHVSGARSFAGRHVSVQRLNKFGEWVTKRVLKLGKRSGKTFRLKLPHGFSRLRVVMSPLEAGPGYLGGRSGTQPVRRR